MTQIIKLKLISARRVFSFLLEKFTIMSAYNMFGLFLSAYDECDQKHSLTWKPSDFFASCLKSDEEKWARAVM